MRIGSRTVVCIVRRDITDSAGMDLSKLWEIVTDREAWRAAVHGVSELDMTATEQEAKSDYRSGIDRVGDSILNPPRGLQIEKLRETRKVMMTQESRFS